MSEETRIAEFLIRKIEEKGMSVTEFCKATGLSVTFYYNMKERKSFHSTSVHKIVVALGIEEEFKEFLENEN